MINYEEKIAEILAQQIPDLEKAEILGMIEKPQDSRMGDYAFPCFRLAKVMKKAPPLIAGGITEAIESNTLLRRWSRSMPMSTCLFQEMNSLRMS